MDKFKPTAPKFDTRKKAGRRARHDLSAISGYDLARMQTEGIIDGVLNRPLFRAKLRSVTSGMPADREANCLKGLDGNIKLFQEALDGGMTEEEVCDMARHAAVYFTVIAAVLHPGAINVEVTG